MRLFIYTFTFLLILVSCNQSNKPQTSAPVSHVDYISNRTIRLMNLFKCDSINTKFHTIHAYFSHSKENFDELQTEQFTNYALAFIEFDPNNVDSVVYYYNSKRFRVGHTKRMETVHEFYAHRVINNSLKMKPILNKIFLYERESEDNLFLNELNTDFSKAKFGDEISKRAEIGIDAIEIIYNYIEEQRDSTFGINTSMVEKYEKGIATKTGDNKELHEKLLKAIHEAVGK